MASVLHSSSNAHQTVQSTIQHPACCPLRIEKCASTMLFSRKGCPQSLSQARFARQALCQTHLPYVLQSVHNLWIVQSPCIAHKSGCCCDQVDAIREYWSYCGEIEDLDVMRFPDTGRFKGIAFITFTTVSPLPPTQSCMHVSIYLMLIANMQLMAHLMQACLQQ